MKTNIQIDSRLQVDSTPRRGSAMIGVLMMVLVVASLIGLYLRSATQELEHAYRSVWLQHAVNLAEAGLEEAFWSLNRGDWSGWKAHNGHLVKRIEMEGQANEQHTITVKVGGIAAGNPRVVAEGRITRHGVTIQKQIEMTMSRRGLFANGLTSRNQVRFAGNNASVDSYDSRDGPYDLSNNRNDRGSVASVGVTVDAVTVQNANILGFVATGGMDPIVGPNGSIRGWNSPVGTNVDPDRVSTDFYQDFPEVTAPSTSGASTSYTGGTIGSPNTNSVYVMDTVNVGNNQSLRVHGDVTLVVNQLTVRGELTIGPNSSLTIYLEEDMSVGGTGIVNESATPSRVVIYGTNPDPEGQEIKLHGQGVMHAAIYAPNALVSLRGGGGGTGRLLGAVVGYDIFTNGTYWFSYDEALADFGSDGLYRLGSWREMVRPEDQVDFDSFF